MIANISHQHRRQWVRRISAIPFDVSTIFSNFADEIQDEPMTTQLYIRICKYLRDKIAGTQWEGHVFTVGGCCRDMVLGYEIKDVDLAVDLPNGGVEFAEWLYKNKLSTMHPVIFQRYGTAMLRLRAFPHDDIEIVQTRAEKYTDRNSRNPETAHGSIVDDCMRRDLTINALYYDLTAGKLLDITGRSMDDIRNKVIATPLDPDSTYDDDPIRILRTVRFASRLGWDLPVPIFEAMRRNSDRLSIIKPERLRGEFEKILLGTNPGAAIDMLRACGAMRFIAPELDPLVTMRYLPDSDDTVWDHTLRTLDILPPDLTIRWAALLCDIAMALSTERVEDKLSHASRSRHMVMQVLVRLRYHQPLYKDIIYLCANHEQTSDWGKHAERMDDSKLRRLQYLSGRPEKLDMLLTLVDAYNKSLPAPHTRSRQVAEIRKRDAEMQADGTAMYTYHLPFAERRIKRLLNIEPGPLVEATLEYMMQLAFANPLRSRQEFERLVSAYTPVVPADGIMPLSEEARPCNRHKRGTKKKTELTQKVVNPTKPRRRHHHRRRNKKTDNHQS